MRQLVIVVAVVAALVAMPAAAATVTIKENSTAASWTDDERVIDNAVPSFQVCGTNFSGTVVFKQGLKTGKLATVRTLTLSSYTGCTEYYQHLPSPIVQFSGTRTDGSVTVYFDWYKP